MSKQPAIDAANYLMNVKGLPRDGAIAVASCLYYESKLNPGSQGVQSTERGGVLNPNGAFGIASWNGPRQASLQNFATSKNLPVENVDTQLWFVLNEAANSYPRTWAAIRSTAPYSEIIPVFVHEYENPADHQKEIDAALAIAAEIAPFIANVVPTPVQAPTAPVAPAAPLPPPPVAAPIPAPAPATPLPTVVDKEILAIDGCYAVLAGLPTYASQRVVRYLAERFSA